MTFSNLLWPPLYFRYFDACNENKDGPSPLANSSEDLNPIDFKVRLGHSFHLWWTVVIIPQRFCQYNLLYCNASYNNLILPSGRSDNIPGNHGGCPDNVAALPGGDQPPGWELATQAGAWGGAQEADRGAVHADEGSHVQDAHGQLAGPWFWGEWIFIIFIVVM